MQIHLPASWQIAAVLNYLKKELLLGIYNLIWKAIVIITIVYTENEYNLFRYLSGNGKNP